MGRNCGVRSILDTIMGNDAEKFLRRRSRLRSRRVPRSCATIFSGDPFTAPDSSIRVVENWKDPGWNDTCQIEDAILVKRVVYVPGDCVVCSLVVGWDIEVAGDI